MLHMEELLCTCDDVFSTGDKDLGCNSMTQHHINGGNNRPIKQSHWKTVPASRREMKDAIGELIEENGVETPNSPWALQVMLVKKKDGTTRYCVDYRALSDTTMKDS